MGDYGSAVDWEDDRQEIYALRNKLGKFEDNDWRSIKNPPLTSRNPLLISTKKKD